MLVYFTILTTAGADATTRRILISLQNFLQSLLGLQLKLLLEVLQVLQIIIAALIHHQLISKQLGQVLGIASDRLVHLYATPCTHDSLFALDLRCVNALEVDADVRSRILYLVQNVRAYLVNLAAIVVHYTIFDVIEPLIDLIDLRLQSFAVAALAFGVVDLLHGLGDKDALVGVHLLLPPEPKDRVLHLPNVLRFLLIGSGDARPAHPLVCLANDRDEQVQQQDDVEDGAEDEDQPLTVCVLLQVVRKLA